MSRIKDFRKFSQKTQDEIRLICVKAVLSGKSRVEVASQYGVSRVSVNKWVAQYRVGGRFSLRSEKRGTRQAGALTPIQAATIARLVQKHPPEALKLNQVLWIREAVQALIERECGIRLSLWTVGRYLKRWGFTPQKPICKAYEQDRKAVEKWLKEEYPRIARRAKKVKAQIFWEDETGIRSNHQAGTSYGKRGKTPVIPRTGKRFGFNMISAISNRGKLAFSIFEGSFNGTVCIAFLNRLIRHANGKVFLIWDQHSVHKSAAVLRWIEDHADKIEVFLLPSYSPDLNPGELLNHDIKANAVGRKSAKSKLELKNNVKNHLYRLQHCPRRVMNFFKKPEVVYAAAI